MAELIAEIAVFSALDKTLHYRVPRELQSRVQAGIRVLVPLGRSEASGLILSLGRDLPQEASGITLRPILDVLDACPVLPSDLMALCRWLSSYYFHPIGEVLRTALPSGIDATPEICFRLTCAGPEGQKREIPSELLCLLGRTDGVSLSDISLDPRIRSRARKELKRLEEDRLVEHFYRWRLPDTGPKMVKWAKLVPRQDALPGKSDSPRELVKLLEDSGGSLPLREIRQRMGNADYWIRKLSAGGFIEIEEVEEIRESQYAQFLMPTGPRELTPAQGEAFDAVRQCIEQSCFRPFLLFGVTGSGKTEIYLKLVEEALLRGKGSLILVPEITLSTQMESLFRQRFGSQLAIWHSGLPAGSRLDQWREVLRGRRKVILGVRSAVFMPLSDPGLIIVDEEHDSSYKQDDHLRYHARDVALMRASLLQVPIILGSATPSLQSFQHCRSNRYTFLSLPQRVFDRPLPELEIVDMRREGRKGRILSASLQKALKETVENGEQALIFLNRRGFATFLLCNTCGNVLQCSHCSVSLTYHQKDNLLRCHYCGWERSVPERCPTCDHDALFHHGFGTERVEEEIKRLLPGERLVRIDRDTVSHPGRMVEYLNAVRHHRAKVLIGTQMIAKGHDFPNITLVGIVNADTALQIPDFRAGEITVQLLMQVAGRAGRGDKPGRAILQTYNPFHYTIDSVLKMDYTGFCEMELESREKLQYPPFTRLLKFLVTSPKEDMSREGAHELASICRDVTAELSASGLHIVVLGPSPAPIMKLSKRYRWHVFVKAWTSQDLQRFTEAVLCRSRDVPILRRVQLAVDRDPVTIM